MLFIITNILLYVFNKSKFEVFLCINHIVQSPYVCHLYEELLVLFPISSFRRARHISSASASLLIYFHLLFYFI